MRVSKLLPALAVLSLAVAPAFAADTPITGYKITKQPADPCKVNVMKVYQEANGGALHAVISNGTKFHTVGKLVAATKSGTNMVMDGADFSFSGTGNPTLNLVVSKNPRGVLTGAGVMLSFTECMVAMH